jgi:hypothetical protein
MRKLFPLLTLAAAVAVATPALAQPEWRGNSAAPVIAGAAVGTAVGVGAYNGWYSGSAFATSLGASTGTAIAAGGVAGVGTVVLLEGLTAKCHGFGVLWTPRNECVNGQWVGDQPAMYRHARR